MAESTGSMIANMLGLGPIFGAIADPENQKILQAVAKAIIDTSYQCARIEAKLDLLMESHGIDTSGIAAVPQGMAGDGLRFIAAASGAPHDAPGAAAPEPSGGVGSPVADSGVTETATGNGLSVWAMMNRK